MAAAAACWRLLAALALAAGAGAGAGADGGADGGCRGQGARAHALDCRGAGLTRVPPLPPHLLALDLSRNNISRLPRDALLPAAGLRDLNLSLNPLAELEERALGGGLARLWLDACELRRLPAPALQHLHRLHYLSAEDNALEEVEPAALAGARLLRTLRLARNRLRAVPAPALAALAHLHTLDLAENQITELGDASLPPLPALHTLVLKRNGVRHVSARCFAAVPNLRVLRLEENALTELPVALALLPLLEELSLAHNRVDEAGEAPLAASRRLARLDLRDNPLGAVHPRALHALPHLTTLLVSEARGLRGLPSLAGSARLRVLRAERARLSAVPPLLCRHAPQLRTLDLKFNLLEEIPDLHECTELRVLELSGNAISELDGERLRGLSRLSDLALDRNRLRRVPAAAFTHTHALQQLNLEDNQIEDIDMEAFNPILKLEDLNVGNNVFPALPAGGLRHVRHLKAHNNPRLTRFLPPALLPRVRTLVLSYAYHCCDYLSDGTDAAADGADDAAGVSDFVLVPEPGLDLALWANASDVFARGNGSDGGEARLQALLERWASGAAGGAGSGAGSGAGGRRVSCAPRPGPFLPCVDLFEWWTLRCGVWAVFLLALLGNGTVVFVLVFSRSRLDVPRFLVTNLAAADLCMGLYLGALAVVDAATLGEFRAHAVRWQASAACRLAGFLAVLSSELSVFTLAVITLERNYAITHAMHLNKRLSLRRAAVVMAAGWALALAAAALPLFGVSDYRKFAVCLPFETTTPGSLGYVATLLAVNGGAFLVLLGCYLKMYCAIRGSQAWNSNDSRIAKRMALLVFTDFLCWSPIACSALAAALGARLVSLEHAKVFTVFVLPLNSCCNPFLYAILTKQFKKDCALVCKAIEESRVTRGIGRCRHSSNFSNRQTPANTGSLTERSSRGGGACACARATGGGSRRARLLRWLAGVRRAPAPPPAPRAPPAAPRRTGSVSSSVEFSSSRSDSWRAYGRAPAPRRAASWLVARKTSQDSTLSSSRNDSSGSGATASTGTWRTSRSGGAPPRPRLTRQPALCADEPPEPPPLPPPPRHLHTIPSAAEDDTR